MHTMLRTTNLSKGGAKVEVFLCHCRHILCYNYAICAKVVLLCATGQKGIKKVTPERSLIGQKLPILSKIIICFYSD